LFPDTYSISKDMKEKDLIDSMVKRFRRVFKEEAEREEPTEGQSLSEREIVTLASIIEKKPQALKRGLSLPPCFLIG